MGGGARSMRCQRRFSPTYCGFLLFEGVLCGSMSRRDLTTLLERAPVALNSGLERGELAVGGALGSTGHLSAGGELREGLAHPEGFGGVVTAFVDSSEPLVGVASDELLSDTDLVEFDGPLGVAALDGQLGLLVALHRGLEVAERVFFSPDPRPFLLLEPVEG